MSDDSTRDNGGAAHKRPGTRFLKRYIMRSDHHGFIGRIYDLSVAGMRFDTYEEVSRYPDFAKFPITRYDWLTVTTDVFLMRYVSVIDCALLLVNEVFRLALNAKQCTIGKLRKKGIPAVVDGHLQMMLDEQEALRVERNSRIHHGSEREFTEDDMTFRMASTFGVVGKNKVGRPINPDRSFKEGLVVLQRDFNIRRSSCRSSSIRFMIFCGMSSKAISAP